MRRSVFTLLVAVSLATPSLPALADPPKSLSETLIGPAKQDYDAAKLLFVDKDYAGAAVKYRSAYEKSKDPRLLWNIAACEKQLRHYSKARGLIRRYLDEGGTLLGDSDRKEAEEALAALEPFTTALVLKIDPAGAEVTIDDEVVGTSPIDKPVSVDLGARKLRIKKAGFKEHVATVHVSGEKTLTLEVKLAPEQHEATLTVRGPAEAEILLDGKPLGKGSFSGKVPSGGHTLRVTAPGRRAHQAELTLIDDEHRTIDVVLDPAPGAPEPEEPPGPRFSAGLRTGYGLLTSNGGGGIAPLGLEFNVNLGRVVSVGLHAQAGLLSRGATCGSDAHGATPASPTDVDVRYSFTGCSYVRAGLAVLFHTRPRSTIDPWFGADFGVHRSSYAADTYDPLGSGAGTDNGKTFALQAGAQLGVDLRVFSFEGLAVGPFAAGWFSVMGEHNFDAREVRERSARYQVKHPVTVGLTAILFGVRTTVRF